MSGFLTEHHTAIKLSGSPYEIGFQHGNIAKEKVHKSIDTYKKLFQETSNISWEEACNKALLHVPAIKEYNANFIQEMEGLAEGAGVQFVDILALNARSEIALSHSPDGCTSFALANPKSSKTWLAQNWDWKGTQIDSLIHLEIEQDGLPTLEMITEAGIIGKIGCNSAGIGVCLNALVTNTWEAKVPIHLGLRSILESRTFNEAVDKVKDNQMASPAHFLIASSSEGMASMEVSPIRTATLQSTNGVLAHTNHLCSVEMRESIKEEIAPNSYHRLDTINDKLQSVNKQNIDEEDLFRLLSNHDNFPTSICRHATDYEEDSMLTEMETVFSIIMNLTDKKLTWIKGKPCEHIKA